MGHNCLKDPQSNKIKTWLISKRTFTYCDIYCNRIVVVYCMCQTLIGWRKKFGTIGICQHSRFCINTATALHSKLCLSLRNGEDFFGIEFYLQNAITVNSY